MKALMISAVQSGAGKTLLSCAILRALQRRGHSLAAFKCGPDYLDPLFHQQVLGAASDNLDLFLQGRAHVHQSLASSPADIALIEAAMGFYDGIAGSDKASAWHLAQQEQLPTILALTPSGSSLTFAAQLRGVLSFRSPCMVAGIILTRCSQRLASHLSPIIERECHVPVLGFLPNMEEADFASRHLGLVRAHEIEGFNRRIDAVATKLEQHCKLDALIELAQEITPAKKRKTNSPARCRIAIARDEAFCFYYEAALKKLEECGAELVEFSPIHSTSLPEADALYLGGGYPELYGAALAANKTMRDAVHEAVLSGLPTVAECGGFLYLQHELVDEKGEPHAMAKALAGRAEPAGRLVRFGYAELFAETDSLLLRAQERLPVHEFHHWDTNNNGSDLVAHKLNGSTWRCCHTTPTLYAGFPHLHLAGALPLAKRLVKAAVRYRSHL